MTDERLNLPSLPPLTLLSWPYRRGVLNPYTERLGDALAERGVQVHEFSVWHLIAGQADVWHMHWPEGALRGRGTVVATLRLVAFALLVAMARARGIACVWTVHNLQSHDRTHPRLERWLWRFLVPRLHGLVLLSWASQEPLWKHHPAARHLPQRVVPHGHFRGLYPDSVDRATARAHYGMTGVERVVVFVGRIRAYKNVDRIITAVREMSDPDLRLIVAGHPDNAVLASRLHAAADHDPRIRLDLRFVPDHAMQYPLKAADLVVLPYQDILNSGAAILALSFARPVLVPDRGAMGELRALVGHPWVQCYVGPLTATVLTQALDETTTITDPAAEPDLAAFDWTEGGRQLVDFYSGLRPRHGPDSDQGTVAGDL